MTMKTQRAVCDDGAGGGMKSLVDLRESVDSWWDDLSALQKNVVQSAQKTYGFTQAEVRDAIEFGLLRWGIYREWPGGWFLEEVEQ